MHAKSILQETQGPPARRRYAARSGQGSISGRRAAALACVCWAAVVLAGCVNTPDTEIIERRDADNSVRLGPGGRRGAFYNHPRSFTTPQMRAMLQSINFARYSFFRWLAPARLFSRADIEFLAPALKKAFEEAGPRQAVQFSVLDNRASTPGQTRGRMFVVGETLGFVLDELAGEKWDDPKRAKSVQWKLSPVEYQSLKKKSGVAGEVEIENWLVFDLSSLPLMRFQLDAEIDVRKKLKELRDLYEQGLITEEQFRAKQVELLDEPF